MDYKIREDLSQYGFERIVEKVTFSKNHVFIYDGDPLDSIKVYVIEEELFDEDLSLEDNKKFALDIINIDPKNLRYGRVLKNLTKLPPLDDIKYTEDTLISECKKQLHQPTYDKFYSNIIVIQDGIEIYVFNPQS